MPPKVTAGGPRPKREDYKDDAAYQKAVNKWVKLNQPSTSSNAPATQQGVVDTKNVESQFRTITNTRTDWQSFGDGTFTPQAGDPTVGQTPYVTAQLEGYGEKKQTPVVILPSNDRKGFTVVAIEEVLGKLVTEIKRDPKNFLFWKTQLKDYYKSDKEYQISVSGGPITDVDTGFVSALRNALGRISYDNYTLGAETLKAGIKNSTNFYDINEWVLKRTPSPGRQSQSSSTRNFTLREDAIADFMREVQQQVGDPSLVNNVDALAEAYWNKVHSEELKRMSRSSSIFDPLTNTGYSQSTGFAMPSEQLLKEWRIGFITNGATKKNKIISTGIANVSITDLQDAGGDLGDNYTKLKSYSYEYGVPLSDAQLKKYAAEASIAGGDIEEQKRTIQLASRALYKGLDSYIQAGMKVSTLAEQYSKMKADELELAQGSVDIFDADVQTALTGDKLMDNNSYIALLRQNPNWKFTKKANESAAGFVDTILKTWGAV